jgi:hypothetical protein
VEAAVLVSVEEAAVVWVEEALAVEEEVAWASAWAWDSEYRASYC